jgi:hypothetical protein
MPKPKVDYANVALAISESKPKNAIEVKSFLLDSLLPVLPALLPGIIRKANATTKKYLRATRDILIAANLGK